MAKPDNLETLVYAGFAFHQIQLGPRGNVSNAYNSMVHYYRETGLIESAFVQKGLKEAEAGLEIGHITSGEFIIDSQNFGRKYMKAVSEASLARFVTHTGYKLPKTPEMEELMDKYGAKTISDISKQASDEKINPKNPSSITNDNLSTFVVLQMIGAMQDYKYDAITFDLAKGRTDEAINNGLNLIKKRREKPEDEGSDDSE